MNATIGDKLGHISGEHERIVLSALNGALRAQGVEFVSAQAMQPSNSHFLGHVNGFCIELIFKMPDNIADDIASQFISHGFTLQWVNP